MNKLDKAAFNEASNPSNERNTYQHIFFSFKAGAEWHKNQLTRLVTLAEEVAKLADCEGFVEMADKLLYLCKQFKD